MNDTVPSGTTITGVTQAADIRHGILIQVEKEPTATGEGFELRLRLKSGDLVTLFGYDDENAQDLHIVGNATLSSGCSGWLKFALVRVEERIFRLVHKSANDLP